jgi:hypothetical protein
MVNNGEIIATAPIAKDEILYLRTIASNTTKKASFEYSINNKNYIKLGNELTMKFNLKIFTGNKFGLFYYATQKTGGYVDYDWFNVE